MCSISTIDERLADMETLGYAWAVYHDDDGTRFVSVKRPDGVVVTSQGRNLADTIWGALDLASQGSQHH